MPIGAIGQDYIYIYTDIIHVYIVCPTWWHSAPNRKKNTYRMYDNRVLFAILACSCFPCPSPLSDCCFCFCLLFPNLLQIEETAIAGRRHALVTGGRSLNANNNRGGMSNSDDTEETSAGEGGEEAGGLLATVGGYSRRAGSRKVAAAAAAVAPACAGGMVSVIGSRRKAAVGAGRAKRRGSFGKVAGAGGTRAATLAAAAVAAEVGSSSSSSRAKVRLSPNKPPLKVSRSLFIEIENKASEPPRKGTPARGQAASRRHHNGVAVHGRMSASGDDADDEQGDSDGESIFL